MGSKCASVWFGRKAMREVFSEKVAGTDTLATGRHRLENRPRHETVNHS